MREGVDLPTPMLFVPIGGPFDLTGESLGEYPYIGVCELTRENAEKILDLIDSTRDLARRSDFRWSVFEDSRITWWARGEDPESELACEEIFEGHLFSGYPEAPTLGTRGLMEILSPDEMRGANIHVALNPDVIWWTVNSSVPSYTYEVDRNVIVESLFWTVPDRDLPGLVRTAAQQAPAILISALEGNLSLVTPGAEVMYSRPVSRALEAEDWALLLRNEDAKLRQRAILLFGQHNNKAPDRERVRNNLPALNSPGTDR